MRLALIVEVHRRGLWVLFAGQTYELVDSMHVRESLHSKLAVEAAPNLAVLLVWTHDSMPDYTSSVQN